MSNKEIKVEVIKVASKEELTIKLLTQRVGDGIRRSNKEITQMVADAFGTASINCVCWYASKLRKDPKYREKYEVNEDDCFLTPRVDRKD